MTKIGIIGAGTGALPPEVLKMAEEANVEIVELDKDYSPTDIPQFEDRSTSSAKQSERDSISAISI